MEYDMLFAVIFYIQEMTASAFLSPQSMITMKLKNFTAANTSCSDEARITQFACIKI